MNRSSRSEDLELHEEIVHTLFQQSHMLPLSLDRNPVYWEYDHSLYLYPLPHLFVLSEDQPSYQVEYSGSRSVNPGSFRTHGSFILYELSSNSVHFHS